MLLNPIPDFLKQFGPKLVSADQAVRVVKPGDRVYVGTACGTPVSPVEALERRHPSPADVELFYFLTSGSPRSERSSFSLRPSLLLRRYGRARHGARWPRRIRPQSSG